jgi:hypothetical protein
MSGDRLYGTAATSMKKGQWSARACVWFGGVRVSKGIQSFSKGTTVTVS